MDKQDQLDEVAHVQSKISEVKTYMIQVVFEPLEIIKDFTSVLTRTDVLMSELEDVIVRQRLLEFNAQVRSTIRLLLRFYKDHYTGCDDKDELPHTECKCDEAQQIVIDRINMMYEQLEVVRSKVQMHN